MRKTEVTATSGFKEAKSDTHENEVVLQMIAESVLEVIFFPRHCSAIFTVPDFVAAG